ncbi:hypothetical protein FRC12_024222, partial [Ceratobasidium sp. 428]
KYSNIVSSSTSLELHIELEANGLQTTERSLEHTSGDHVSLLKKLQRHRDAWLDLNIRSSTNHDCNLEDMTFWELRDGVFAKAFIRHTGLGSVLLLPLDSGECRTQVDFDTTFNVLTMDLGQDLITLAGVEPDQFVILFYFILLVDRPVLARSQMEPRLASPMLFYHRTSTPSSEKTSVRA